MNLSKWIASIAVAIAVIVFFLPAPDGWTPDTLRAAAVVILTIGLFATVVVAEYLTALIFFFFCIVLSVAPPNVVFSGFVSGPVWLVFGGIIIGLGMEATGLAQRIAGSLEKPFARSYFRLITSCVFVMFLLAFLMPSSLGRIMIMLPIVIALAERLGFIEGSNGRAGMILATAMGSLTPTFAILPASVPNVVLAGASEAVYGIQFSYGSYLLLHLPIIGFVSIIFLPIFIFILFPDKVSVTPEPRAAVPFGVGERRMLFVLIICLALWATDTMHGVSPAWVALGGGIVCALPISGIIPNGPLLQKMNLGPVLFLAGVIGLGSVVAHTGIGAKLGQFLIDIIPLNSDYGLATFYSLVGLGTALQLLTTLPGQPAIMTPLAETLSQASGWPLISILMAQVPAWTLLIFPYQAPPLVATRSISGLAVRQFVKLLVPFAVFSCLILLPLQYLWWIILGYVT